MNTSILNHPLEGTVHVYRPDMPHWVDTDDETRDAVLANKDVVIAPGMKVRILSVFQNWNQVSGLDMLYVHVPHTGYHTHVTPSDLGLPPI